jgi:ferritin-like metal-binding protein YciE
MAIGSLAEKFSYELRCIYDAEHHFLDAMREMASMASDGALRVMLEEHIGQTRHQIANLEQVFRLLEQEPRRGESQAAAGLVADGRTILGRVAGHPALINAAIAGALAKVEHFEVASYRGLVAGAELLGRDPVIGPLRENKLQEERASQLTEHHARTLLQTAEASDAGPGETFDNGSVGMNAGEAGGIIAPIGSAVVGAPAGETATIEGGRSRSADIPANSVATPDDIAAGIS